MIISVPKELKQSEKRVGITPSGTSELVQLGHQVLIQSSAGILSGFSDNEYQKAGAEIVSSLSDVWERAEILVKVKEPHPDEYKFFREDLCVFSFLHPAADRKLTEAMLKGKVTGLDYDLVTLEDRSLPILAPMSEIAGKLSVQIGARHLEASGEKPSLGILMGGTNKTPPAKVLVIGAGVAGQSAALVASGMGAECLVLDINQVKLDMLKKQDPRIQTKISSPEVIANEALKADLLIGAVLVPGAKAPQLIKKEHIKSMKENSIMVDICIDQGGFAETSKATTITEPSYIIDGVIHICIANMPALVPKTSTSALTEETLPWIKLLANSGVEKALKEHSSLMSSLTMYKGKLTNKEIGEAFGIEFEKVCF